MENNNIHKHNNCDCGHEHCDCEHEHNNKENKTHPFKIGTPCILEPETICNGCKACLMCDLNPEKICDNCGMCLDAYNTDEKGYLSIPIDKIITDMSDDASLEDLFKQYGLDGDEE